MLSSRVVSRAAARRELIRGLQFGSVSLASACANLLYVALLSRLTTLPFWFVSLSSTEFSMVVNFLLNDRITFRTLARERAWYVRLLRFQIAALAGNVLTAAISASLYSEVRLSALYAQGIAIVTAFFFNFVAHRFWTFRSHVGARSAAKAETGNLSAAPNYPMGLTIVVPVRNEAGAIQPLLLRLRDAVDLLQIPYEILIIDDRSTDETVKVAAWTIGENNLPARVIGKQGKPGKSFSLLEGFAAARYSILAMIDGDLELPPEYIPQMVLQLDTCDLVIGKREGYGINNAWRAKLSAAFNTFIVHRFLGLPYEPQTGIKVFRRAVYDSIVVHPGRWSFDLEFVTKAHAQHYRITEHPVPFMKRQVGRTKVRTVSVAWDLMKSAIRIKLSILRTPTSTVGAASRSDAESLRLIAGFTGADTLSHTPAVSPQWASSPASVQHEAGTLTSRGAVKEVKSTGVAGLQWVVEWALPYALLLFFLRRLMGPAFFSSNVFIGLPGDTNQYMWFIGWIWHAIGQGTNPFVSDAFGYPGSIRIMDFTSVPLLGFAFGWLYTFLHVELVYNIIFVVNYLLVFLFGKLILRGLHIGRVASSVGALLFCLLPYLTAQELGHLNLDFLAPNFMVCYVVIRVLRAERRPGFVSGLWLGLALLMSFYTFLETFSTLVLFLVVLLVWGFIAASKTTIERVRHVVRLAFLAGAVIPLLLAIPGALNFIQGQTGGNLDFTFAANYYVNDVLSFILPFEVFALHNYATVTTVHHFTGNASEWDGYLSVPFILAFIVHAVLRWADARIRVFALTAATFLVFSLGPHLHVDGIATHVTLPWALMLNVPFIKSALPSRLAVYTEALGIIIIMYGVDKSFKGIRLPNLRFAQLPAMSANTCAVLLVILCWLPITPWPSASLPHAAAILSQDRVVARYLDNEPTLILYDNNANGFAWVMGVLAASKNYDLIVSDVYGHDMANTPSFKINTALADSVNPKAFGVALREYLPTIGARRVMFVSIDDQLLTPPQLTQITSYLGPPVYDGGGLVIVWNSGA